MSYSLQELLNRTPYLCGGRLVIIDDGGENQQFALAGVYKPAKSDDTGQCTGFTINIRAV